MARRFEVGKRYAPYGCGYDPIKVVRRTEKTIWVEDSTNVQWSMRVRIAKDGNEYAIDCTVPNKWRDEFTYFATEEV